MSNFFWTFVSAAPEFLVYILSDVFKIFLRELLIDTWVFTWVTCNKDRSVRDVLKLFLLIKIT